MAQVERLRKNLTQPGILAALGAALLFGSGTPLAKLLLADVSPWLMAALLYLGSGIGLTLYRLLRRAPAGHLLRGEWPWLAGAIFTGALTGFAGLAATGYASDRSIDASKCLETKIQVAQEIGNVFSRTIPLQVNGFDPFVRRVSGTGIYRVEKVTLEQIVTTASFLYDGNPVSTGENIIKDGGRTLCWKGDCSAATDATGVSINPLLWGAPKGKLHVGQSWDVEIAVPWELGPAGKQVVKVVSIDASNDSITLQRQGEDEGDAVNEIKKLPLVKDKKTYTVDVSAGRAKWSGYTTFRRGVVLSDVLLVERTVTVTSKEMGQSSGTQRQYILLNATPPHLLPS